MKKGVGNMLLEIEDYFNTFVIKNNEKIFKNLGDVNSKHEKSLVYALNLHYFNIANENPNVSAIIINSDLQPLIGSTQKNIIIEKSPKVAFWNLHNHLVIKGLMCLSVESYIGKNSNIHTTAVIHDNVWIGDNVIIDAGAIILPNTVIKNDVHIHSGAVIGSEGMQVIKDEENQQIFINHAGGVMIEKGVNILSGANVSKAVDLSYTIIGENSVISIHASVGHNVQIGKNCMLAGNVLVGGSTIIKDNVWIGPSSTIKDSLVIENNVSIKLGSVVVKDIKENEEVSGNFAYNHIKRIRNFMKEQR